MSSSPRLDAYAGQVPAKTIRRVQGSVLRPPFSEDNAQSASETFTNKELPPLPIDPTVDRAELPGHPLPQYHQTSRPSVSSVSSLKLAMNKNRRTWSAKSHTSKINHFRDSFYHCALGTSHSFHGRISTPWNPIHMNTGTKRRTQAIPLITISPPRETRRLQARPSSTSALSNDSAWKICYQKEVKERRKFQKSLELSQTEARNLKEHVELVESVSRAQKLEIEETRLELGRLYEQTAKAESETRFKQKSLEHREREIARLQKQHEEYMGLSPASKSQRSLRPTTLEHLERQLIKLQKRQEEIMAFLQAARAQRVSRPTSRSTWRPTESQAHELSASASHQVLAQPVPGTTNAPHDQIHELSATASHQVLRSMPEEPAAVERQEYIVESIPYQATELERLQGSFTDVITAQTREEQVETSDIPDSPTLPAARTAPIQTSILSLGSPAGDVIPVSQHSPLATHTAFQFGSRRVEGVPPMFRVPLTTAKDGKEEMQDSNSKDSISILPALDKWEWSSIPDLKLRDPSLEE